jgi:hypothetical protein
MFLLPTTFLLALLLLRKGRRIRIPLQIDSPELVYSQSTALSAFKFFESIKDGLLLDLYYVNNFSNSSAEIVHSSSQYQCGTADSRWSTTRGHPVTVHTLDNTGSVVSDSHSLLAEFQALAKSKN